jgi:gliding motility-associated-like protein
MIWPDTNTTYYLTLTDEIGCHFTDSVRVMVRDKPFSLFFIPNAITPDNGDGYNDYWNIRDLERYPDNEVRIVNRWGDEVYFAKPYQNNWAGTWKGDKLPGGTYYYIIKIKFNGETITFNGPLTIIR